MISGKKMLVVSAHPADYVWRSGGTIAHYINHGAQVKVLVLSFGIRGESNDLWNQEGATHDSVRDIRQSETLAAAKILGLDGLDFWHLDDYPMELTREHEDKLVREIRAMQPDIILTHDKFDVLNPDHNMVSDFTFRCSVMSNSNGVRIDGTKTSKQMRIYGFEPHQTELSNYKPGIFVDITDGYEQKVQAMKCFKAQGHLIEYYTQRAFMRGNHARRISGDNSYKYAESFACFFPVVASELV